MTVEALVKWAVSCHVKGPVTAETIRESLTVENLPDAPEGLYESVVAFRHLSQKDRLRKTAAYLDGVAKSEAMELDYFPPQGTKYKWYPPCLRRRPWCASIKFTDRVRSCNLRVFRRTEGALHKGWVEFQNLYRVRLREDTAYFRDGKEAVLATEALADRMLALQNLPAWAEEALSAGWLP